MRNRWKRTMLVILAGMGMPALAQEEAPKSFRINNIRSLGTGCPIGTVMTNISDDQQAFTLSFSEFFAEVSPTLGIRNQRKTCRVVFDTEQDSGWEYAIFGVTYRGFAGLDTGVRGEQDLRFGGIGRQARSTMTLLGPYDDNYVNSQEVPVNSLTWSGCQSNRQKDFTIDAVLSLQAPDGNSQGLFTVDTVDGEVRQEYEVLWRECRGGRKPLAVCRLNVQAKKGTFPLFTKHASKNQTLAMTMARTKMARKCQKLKRIAPNCDAEKAQCSLLSL